MPFQCRNRIWQSLEKGAGKRCSESEGTPYLRAAVHRHCQRRPKRVWVLIRLGAKCVGRVPSRFKRFSLTSFMMAYAMWVVIKESLVKFELSVTNLLLFEHQRHQASAWNLRSGLSSPPPPPPPSSLLKQTVCVDVGRRGSVVLLSGTSCYPARLVIRQRIALVPTDSCVKLSNKTRFKLVHLGWFILGSLCLCASGNHTCALTDLPVHSSSFGRV